MALRTGSDIVLDNTLSVYDQVRGSSQVDFLAWRCRLSEWLKDAKRFGMLRGWIHRSQHPTFWAAMPSLQQLRAGSCEVALTKALSLQCMGHGAVERVGLSIVFLKNSQPKRSRSPWSSFSPWQIRGVDELTLQFFAQVHDHLGAGTQRDHAGGLAKREKMWMALARLERCRDRGAKGHRRRCRVERSRQKFRSRLDGCGRCLKTLCNASPKRCGRRSCQSKSRLPVNAEEARQELAKLFSEPELPSLLVVMDDFDRLTSEEIQALVRLIKANANFPG